MGSKAIGISTLVLRIFTLLALVACVVLLVTISFGDDYGPKITFKDLTTYSFVLSAAVIGSAHTLLQLPFALCYAFKEKRLIKGDLLQAFDFFGDKVKTNLVWIIAFLLASGVGAGFAVSVEFKKLFTDYGTDDGVKFLNRGMIATGALAFGFVCMALLSVLSSTNQTDTIKGSFG